LKRGGTEAAEENKSYRGFALMNADQEEIAKIARIAKIAEIEKQNQNQKTKLTADERG